MNKKSLVLLVLVPIMFGCYPEMDTTIDDLDTVITIYDEEQRENNGYSNYRTFTLPDTIIHIIDEENPDNNLPISREYDEFILNNIRQNMLSLGFTELPVEVLDPGNLPGVFILVEAQAQKTFVQSVYCYPPGWGWGGWWGYYPGYPGWGGCGSSVYSYNTGSIFINMIDPDKIGDRSDDDVRDPANVWLGIANGLLANTTAEVTQERIGGLLDRAFKQSPYLSQSTNLPE